MLEAVCAGERRVVVDLLQHRRCVAARHPFTMCSTVHLAVIHQEYELVHLLLSHPDAPAGAKDIVSPGILIINVFLQPRPLYFIIYNTGH